MRDRSYESLDVLVVEDLDSVVAKCGPCAIGLSEVC